MLAKKKECLINEDEPLLLDHRESFCDHDKIVGYLYYSMWQVLKHFD